VIEDKNDDKAIQQGSKNKKTRSAEDVTWHTWTETVTIHARLETMLLTKSLSVHIVGSRNSCTKLNSAAARI
jgi:hypothetical protein